MNEYFKKALEGTLEKDEPRATRRMGNIELRYDHKGEIDEIVLFGKDGTFHLERMDNNRWWFALNDDENGFALHVNFTTPKYALLPVPEWTDWPDGAEEKEEIHWHEKATYLHYHIANWFANNESGTPVPEWCSLTWPIADDFEVERLIKLYEEDTGKVIEEP